MINETAAKAMNLKNPVGTIIHYGDHPATVIGVYKDFVWGSPFEKVAPMYTLCSTTNIRFIAMRLNSKNSLTDNIAEIEKQLKLVNPAYPPVVKFANAEYEAKFQAEKLSTR